MLSGILRVLNYETGGKADREEWGHPWRREKGGMTDQKVGRRGEEELLFSIKSLQIRRRKKLEGWERIRNSIAIC